MLKMLPLVFVVLFAVAGCAKWNQVPVQVDPTAVTDPAREIESVLNLVDYLPLRVEVTDQYIKQIFAGGGGYTQMLLFAKVADMRVITKDNVYQVSAYDPTGEEIWVFRPGTEDLATCKRFLNAFYAASKRPLPTNVASAAGPSKLN